jgi:hypothetical protein
MKTLVSMKINPPHKEKIAPKYCFKATAHLRVRASNQIVGSFTAYDKSPEVAAQVQRMCREYVRDGDESVDCTLVDLVLLEECPTECDGEVSVMFYGQE